MPTKKTAVRNGTTRDLCEKLLKQPWIIEPQKKGEPRGIDLAMVCYQLIAQKILDENLTQEQAAALYGTRPTTLAYWLRGRGLTAQSLTQLIHHQGLRPMQWLQDHQAFDHIGGRAPTLPKERPPRRI